MKYPLLGELLPTELLESLHFSSLLGHVCFPEISFRETMFQTFLCLFAIKKVGQRKTLSGQQKTLSIQRKTLSIQRKTLSCQSERKIF